MPRTPHYWRSAGRTATPSNLLVFDSETIPDPERSSWSGEYHVLRLGCALAYRLEQGRRTRVSEITYRDSSTFWHFLERRLCRQRPLWVFAHNLAFDLGTVRGWTRLREPDCLWSQVVCEGGITFFRGTMAGRGLVLCDSCNYYHCSLAAIGQAVSLPKMTMPDFGATDSLWEEYCRNDVAVCAAGMDALIAFWRTHQLGPWGMTIASLAWRAYCARYLHHRVLVHTHPNMLRLERAAYYGGRVDTPYLGRVPASQVTELDYTSLYPSTYTEPLPCTPVCHVAAPRPADVLRWLRGYHVLADCTLRVTTPDYPVRRQHRVWYPIGTYRTILADPEFRRAIAGGEVVYVHQAAVYRTAPLFREYLDGLCPLKERYDREGNSAFRVITKYLLNSLYGKTGQLTPAWMSWGEEARRALETTWSLPAGVLDRYADWTPDLAEMEEMHMLRPIPDLIAFRHMWGVLEVQVGRRESRDSCPAIAATVTSYGRLRLLAAQQAAGPQHWYYSDTDSLWCDVAGVEGVQRAGLLGEGQLGRLSARRTVAQLTIHGRKDYEYDGERRLKGVRPSAEPAPDGGWIQLHFPSAMQQLRARLEDGVFVARVVKHLRRTVDWCHPGSDGWTRPLMSPGEIPPENGTTGIDSQIV